jgi:hypothetical protein
MTWNEGVTPTLLYAPQVILEVSKMPIMDDVEFDYGCGAVDSEAISWSTTSWGTFPIPDLLACGLISVKQTPANPNATNHAAWNVYVTGFPVNTAFHAKSVFGYPFYKNRRVEIEFRLSHLWPSGIATPWVRITEACSLVSPWSVGDADAPSWHTIYDATHEGAIRPSFPTGLSGNQAWGGNATIESVEPDDIGDIVYGAGDGYTGLQLGGTANAAGNPFCLQALLALEHPPAFLDDYVNEMTSDVGGGVYYFPDLNGGTLQFRYFFSAVREMLGVDPYPTRYVRFANLPEAGNTVMTIRGVRLCDPPGALMMGASGGASGGGEGASGGGVPATIRMEITERQGMVMEGGSLVPSGPPEVTARVIDPRVERAIKRQTRRCRGCGEGDPKAG